MVARIRLGSGGRGKNYSTLRGVMESGLRLAYPWGWPGRLWGMVPSASRVALVQHELGVLPTGRRRPALRVAFISDLHIGPTTPPKTLDRAFRLLASLAPDVLILGGDYVFLDATTPTVAELQRRVAAVPARTKVAVLGNHDLWSSHARVERALRDAGAQVLVNEALRLPPPFDDVAVLGLDDPWTGQIDAERALASCTDAALKLAVCHSPDGYDHVAGSGVALLLCGHTHGGQIALPGGRALVLPPGRRCRAWPHGLHRPSPTAVFVSRGVGTTELPVRWNAPPEVALFVLT